MFYAENTYLSSLRLKSMFAFECSHMFELFATPPPAQICEGSTTAYGPGRLSPNLSTPAPAKSSLPAVFVSVIIVCSDLRSLVVIIVIMIRPCADNSFCTSAH